MSSTESRGTPLVEVIVQPPEQAAAGAGRLRGAMLFGMLGAVTMISVASLGGGVFLPWFSTSAEGVPSSCEPHIEAAVAEAVGNLLASQTLAGCLGFFFFAGAAVFLRGRRKARPS